MAKTASLKPTIFLASSAEGLELAYAIQKNLEKDAEIVLWWERFTPGTLTFHSLLETLKSSDFAVIGLTPDDVSSRASRADSGNLLFQTGLYIGALGLDRTFLIVPDRAAKHLPSDLSGIFYLAFDQSQDLTKAVSAACAYVRRRIRSLELREGKEIQPVSKTSQKKKSRRLKTPASKRRAQRVPDQKQVFISYSHKDKRWLEKLRTLLVPSIESNSIFLWDDSMIKPGDEWEKKIEGALDAVRVAVLLVSPDFLASRFISKVELPPLLDGAKKKGIRILWLYVRACDYERTAIARYQAAHDISKPLKALGGAKQDQELLNIVKKINEAAK